MGEEPSSSIKVSVRRNRKLGETSADASRQVVLELNRDPPPGVLELNQLITERFGIPGWAQRIFYKGRMLRGSSSLEEQGVLLVDSILLLATSAHCQVADHISVSGAGAVSSEAGGSEPSVVSPPPLEGVTATETVVATGSREESHSSNNAPSTTSREVASAMTIAELKQRLSALGVSIEGCTEKAELVELLLESEANGLRPVTPTPVSGGPTSGTGAAPIPGSSPGQQVPVGNFFGIPMAGMVGGPGTTSNSGMGTFGSQEFFFSSPPQGGDGQQVNPMEAFFSQLGPLMSGAMSHGNVQVHAYPGTQGQPRSVPTGTGANPGPPLANLFEQVGPQLMAQMGAAFGQSFPPPQQQQQQQQGTSPASPPVVVISADAGPRPQATPSPAPPSSAQLPSGVTASPGDAGQNPSP